MKPIHSGLKNEKLFTTDEMVSVSVCLDSGKLAGGACAADVRGSRVKKTMCYPEDKPTSHCDKHISKTICSASKDLANDYCSKFAEVNPEVRVGTMSQVKLTQSEINAIKRASGKGLLGMYSSLNYLVSNDVCTLHTAETWEAYLKQKEEEQQQPQPPTDPNISVAPIG